MAVMNGNTCRRMWPNQYLIEVSQAAAASVINDSAISLITTWSSSKINNLLNGKQNTLIQGDGINLYEDEISVKVGEGLFYDSNDAVCLNAATRQTLADVANKANTADLIENNKIKTSLLPIYDGGSQ